MALKLHFASLSFGASVDQQTGGLSVFEIIDEIRAPQVPIQLPQIVISLSLEKTHEEASQGKLFIHLDFWKPLSYPGTVRIVSIIFHQSKKNIFKKSIPEHL